MPDEPKLFNRFSQRAGYAVMIARLVAGKAGASVIDTEDLLTGLVYVDRGLVAECGASLTVEGMPAYMHRWRISQAVPVPQSRDMPISEDVGAVFSRSEQLADEVNSREIRTEHLLLSLMLAPECHGALALLESGGSLERSASLAPAANGEPQMVSESVKLSIGELFN